MLKDALRSAFVFVLVLTQAGGVCLAQTLREYADRSAAPAGAAVEPRPFDEPEYVAALAREFNVPTAANVLKWGAIRPDEGKEIAVTIDDLPLNGPRVGQGRLRAMTDRLLAGIGRHKIPAVGFVNESLLYVPGETDAMIAVLKAWADAGVELGNHTFAHLRFTDVPPAEYEDDVVRGETLTRALMREKGGRVRYFRHPFLQMGATREAEQAFESFLAARGYRVAPVTVDTLDWMFLSAYAKARARGDAGMLKRVSDEYLRYVGLKLDFCEKVSAGLFGRPVRHILLLHANELNADNFEALLRVFEERGYKFITLERALEDPAYRFPEKYTATSDWLAHWSFSKGTRFDPPAAPEFIRKIFQGGQ